MHQTKTTTCVATRGSIKDVVIGMQLMTTPHALLPNSMKRVVACSWRCVAEKIMVVLIGETIDLEVHVTRPQI